MERQPATSVESLKFSVSTIAPLVAVIFSYAHLMSSVTSINKDVADLKAQVEQISPLKERTSILETKFDAINDALTKIDGKMDLLTQTLLKQRAAEATPGQARR